MKNCYCCKKKVDKVTTILGFNLCDKCLKDYEDARKEVDKLR